MTTDVFHRHASMLFVLLPMICACTKQAPGQDPARAAEAALRGAEVARRALAALPPECVLGTASHAAQGSWLAPTKAATDPDNVHTFVYTFDTAVTTRAVRIGLNRQALRDLEKVEVGDGRGNWSDAGPLAAHDAAAACDYVWLQQELAGARQVGALRYSFREAPGTITGVDPGLLQAPPGPNGS